MIPTKSFTIFIAGILLLIGSLSLFLFLVIPRLHSFLSKSEPVPAKVLVVQGWIFDTMMDQAVAEFRRGNYERIIVTGDTTSLENAVKKLKNRGIMNEVITTAPGKNRQREWHHTFAEAFSLKWYIDKHAPSIRSVNIVTSAVHGKKTLTIFKKVLGDSIAVGVITCKSNYYNADKVWASPIGIRVTLKFFIGYLYALVWNFKVE